MCTNRGFKAASVQHLRDRSFSMTASMAFLCSGSLQACIVLLDCFLETALEFYVSSSSLFLGLTAS